MTTFGDPVIYTCPSCKKHLAKQTYNSYTVWASSDFSDGYSSGRPPHRGLALAKCPLCGAVFFLHNLAGKTLKRGAADGYEAFLEIPKLGDLITAVHGGIAKTEEEQFTARLKLWRAYNDEIRDEEPPGAFTGTRLRQWEENCAELLKLAIEKRARILEMPLRAGRDDEDGEDADEREEKIAAFTLIIAELYRNLGRFAECREFLEKLPPDYSCEKALIAGRAAAGNRMVFELNRSEGLRLRPRSGETWQTWECGAEDGGAVLATIEYNSLVFSGEGPMRDYAPLPGVERSAAPWCAPVNAAKFSFLFIDENITSLGAYALYGCDYSGTTPFDGKLRRIGKAALSRTAIFYTRVPGTVVEIEEEAYAHCRRLKDFEIQNGVKRVGGMAFFGCVLLSKIHIPRSVLFVGSRAFAHCDSLTEIIIGKRVGDIGEEAFAKSEKPGGEIPALVSVTNHNPVPQKITRGHFRNNELSGAALYVPSGSLDAYKNAPGWNEFGLITAFIDKRTDWQIRQEQEEDERENNHGN